MFEEIPVFPLETPALRPLELIPVEHEQQTLIVVRDPLGLIEGTPVLQPDPMLLIFLEMADGKTTLGEMAKKVTELSGQIVPEGMFQSVAKQLDEALLLQTERFREAMQNKYEEYMKSPVRPYKVFQDAEGDRLKMMKELGEEMRRHEMSRKSPPKQLDLPANSVRAVLSPHIDYQRGGEAYAWAYKALKEKGVKAKTYIILGTSHRPTQNRFIATAKDYDTPFGKVETDQELLKELEEAFGGSLTEEEYAHADEHTIELQATYLKYTFGNDPVKIVPILVGSIEPLLENEDSPRKDPQVAKFCDALRQVMDKHSDVVLIGGVDFSHCGPQFGQEQKNDPEREKEIESYDKQTLETIESGDPEAFFDRFRADMNGQNLCSIAPIYVVMDVMRQKADPKVLTYQQANSQDQSNLVSFASVAFTEGGEEGGGGGDKPKIILVNR